MTGLARRMAKLEAEGPTDLPPAVKQWLGEPLTLAEQERLDAGMGDHPLTATSPDISHEDRAWLGLD